MTADDIITIIFCHYVGNKERSELSRRSFKSLQETTKHLPVELIVVDSGENEEDSKFFLEETIAKRITHYVRNADRLWYGFSRNQALDMSMGKYICSADNDIIFEKGWLDECLNVLKKVQGKYHITPLEIDRAHNQPKYMRELVIVDGIAYQTNALAGSSCWIMTREAYEKIGKFPPFLYGTGSKWARYSSALGYSMILLPEPKATNLGLKNTPCAGIIKDKGYYFEMRKHFTNGESLDLNPNNQ